MDTSVPVTSSEIFLSVKPDFEDGFLEQVVAIPLANAATEPRHPIPINRGNVVCASVGIAAAFLVLNSILVFTIWKGRSMAPSPNESNGIGFLEPRNNGIDICNTVYETDNSGLYRGHRETLTWEKPIRKYSSHRDTYFILARTTFVSAKAISRHIAKPK